MNKTINKPINLFQFLPYKYFIRKSIYIYILCSSLGELNAQGIGINATGVSPDNSAMLDVASPVGVQMGILFPRVNLTTGITSPATHLFGVNTSSAFNAGSRFNSGLGLYRFDSTRWNRLLESRDSSLFWGTRGNAGTNPANDYLGTSDDIGFNIRTNKIKRIEILNPFPGYGGEIVISNVEALRIPSGSASLPSLRFEDNTLGMFWSSYSTTKGIGMRVGTNAYVYFSAEGVLNTNGKFGIRLRKNAATSSTEMLPENSLLDVDGNIFTREKLVYSEYAVLAEKTFKNEFYWDGTITANDSTPELFNETSSIKFRVKRNGSNEYFIGISTSSSRNFTCANNLNQVTTVNPVNISTFVPVSFTTNVTGSNGMQTVIVREHISTAPTYRFTIMVANNNVSVVIERWQN